MKMANLGAGEILATSMDRDGTRSGFDIEHALVRFSSDTSDCPLAVLERLITL